MIDHICIGVRDFPQSRAFYQKVLAPLGYGLHMELDGAAGFGPMDFKPGFWISGQQPPSPQVHYCFRANTRSAVREFFREALAAGAREDWPPGIVEEYHPAYYAAFVFDPDGYKIEALCLEPEDDAVTLQVNE